MSDRPRIPAHIAREILIESGHRCSVCGEGCPLERAHIIPWHESKEHKAEDLICLCANCHERADKEKWGEKALREYKQKPWILRRFESNKESLTEMAQVTMTINDSISEFSEKKQKWLISSISGFLGDSPGFIEIKVIKEGSVVVTIELPLEDAQKLITAYKNNDSELFEYLAPLTIPDMKIQTRQYIGTIVGESTTREFRLAVAASSVREQDIIAVDSEISEPEKPDEPAKQIRVWAKVQKIERLNPLFPQEAGHELAATRTDPFDTVLSLSREMVTAVCPVLGAEPITGGKGKLDQLRYPPKPATRAYRPFSSDIARIVIGDLNDPKKQSRALDIATLANRIEVDVQVDGHAIVSRHLAILAMTGAGKSVTARRIIEELAKKNYPIVIFDPHGDYTGLGEVKGLEKRVRRFYAQFPVFEQQPGTVRVIVETLGSELPKTHNELFDSLFQGAKNFISVKDKNPEEMDKRTKFLSEFLGKSDIYKFGLKPNLFYLANFTEAIVKAGREQNEGAFDRLIEWCKRDNLRITKQYATWLESLPGNLYSVANKIRQMEEISRRVANTSEPLPLDLTSLVSYKGISVIALAGYTGDFQATIYSLIAEKIFAARVANELKLPVLFLLEEAHNFVPAHSSSAAEARSIETTKQIAQEGRKFGVGLILISQRPSRLDETTLSQCNSFVIMRMVNPADQNFVRRVVESLGEDDARNLPNLDVGEALLSGQMINFPVLVKIKEPESKGEREEKDAFITLEEAHHAMSGK